MNEERSLSVVDHDTGELVPYEAPASPLGQISPMNQAVEIPGFLNEWTPNAKELYAKTPKDMRRVAKDKSGKILYRYVPISWFIKQLNKAFDSPYGPMWAQELVQENWGEWYERTNYEGKPFKVRDYTCITQLVWPGQFRPILGVGTSTYYSNNPQESEAKTRNAALSAALKSCCKQLGMGRDVEEDDPDVAGLVDDRVRTIDTLVASLDRRGKSEEARAIITRFEPGALLANGTVLTGNIEFENLEPIQRELQRLGTQAAAVKKAE